MADPCDDLTEEARLRFETLLGVKHDLLVAEESVSLISDWRSEYDDDTLLAARFRAARQSAQSLEIEVEQAKNDWLQADHARKGACGDG